jgi:DNA-binding transcriptional regulator GbsR (MarR family)
MSEEAMHEVLDSLAKIGKHWELGESVGHVWGFLLLKSCPVTQREIEEGTGYSRGLISRCLTVLKKGELIDVSSAGKENRYAINTSLTESQSRFLKRFIADKINPIIEALSRCAEKVEDGKVKENFLSLLHEFKKLNLAFRIFLGVIDDINLNAIAADMEDAEDYEVTVSIEVREDYGENDYCEGGSKKDEPE